MAGAPSVDDREGVVPLAAPTTGTTALDDLGASVAAKLFKALSDPVRVQLVALVRQAPDGEACFCDLAPRFAMPQSSLSHHLKILVAAGILSRERRGTWSWYRVEHDPLAAMETMLRAGGPLREHPAGACE
ncbi:MAG TPA: metalloregulator ArsR/SmtB family transcription factor [Actinokineospora sp.]|jgi:DNA-binding transcriptional ArsR family regulator|nr:metalloregulator ArsR/SmtB family transcription factor [Actinokineospora sp.]